MMGSMDIAIEIAFGGNVAGGPVELNVEFTFKPGPPASFDDPGDGPEIEIEHVYWPYDRKRHNYEPPFPERIDDHIDMPLSAIPASVMEAIEAHIAEKYEPDDSVDPDWER